MRHIRNLSYVLILIIPVLGFLVVGCQDEPLTPNSAQQGNESPGALYKVTQRPLSDFLDAQTWALIWSSGDDFRYIYFVDYAGAWDRNFSLGIGSTFDGFVKERPLPDGRAEVTVEYRSTNVLTYLREYNPTGPNPVVLGEDLNQVIAGGTPALGDMHFKMTFYIAAPGDPLPDVYSDFELKTIMFSGSVFGPLTAAAGLGPDGTRGHGWTNQIGILQKILFGLKPVGQPGTEIWTAEFVKLEKAGPVN